MKSLSRCFVLGLFFLAACVPAATIPSATPTPQKVVATSTTQPTTVPTATATLAPTKTPVPATPTPDLAHLPTRTPQPPAACPPVDAKLRISLGSVFKNKKAAYHDARQTVLDFLNAGGDPQLAIQKLAENGVTASQLDITQDGIKEFFLPSGYLTILGCQHGKYATLLEIAPTEHTEIAAVPLVIQDLNLNGVPELFIGQAQYSDEAMYRLLEWDGSKLANLIPSKFEKNNTKIYIDDQIVYTIGQSNAQKGALLGNYEIVDTDGNGLKEVVIHAGVYQNWFASSDLEDTLVLKWDGQSYRVGEVSKEATPTPEPTFTPWPYSATCSNKAPQLKYQRQENQVLIKSIVNFLNAGGTQEELNRHFIVTSRDLNNDTAPEVVLIDWYLGDVSIYIFSCQDGKYMDTATFPNDTISSDITILAIADNNRNGFPELFIKDMGWGFIPYGYLDIVEWDGAKFTHRISETPGTGYGNYAEINSFVDVAIKDLDNDGIKELTWKGFFYPNESPDHWFYYPLRSETHVYKWDGANYTAQSVEYAKPEYRFQALQDGDSYAKAGQYDKALKSYELVTQSTGLGWWTEERKNYILGQHDLGPCAEKGANCPPPTPDSNERPILSAYAAFRRMLVQLLTHQQTEAEKTYQDLLSTYLPGKPGYPIVEMSTAFWTEYQASQSIEKSCTKAVADIQAQTDILGILSGGAKHSMQGIDYEGKPEEVCPFK